MKFDILIIHQHIGVMRGGQVEITSLEELFKYMDKTKIKEVNVRKISDEKYRLEYRVN